MKTILVTGASGYVGAKIYKDLLQEGHKVIGTYHSTKLFDELELCDLTNENEVNHILTKHKPDIVIHVAANASNSNAEKDPEAAVDLNVSATKYLVNASKQIGTKFIFISTFAAYKANGVYGKTKLEAEKLVAGLDNYMILRPSLIIGLSPNTKNDRPFNRILKNILDGDKEVQYDNSWEFHPTFLSHLSRICIQLIESDNFNNTMLPVVSNTIVSRYLIAKDILSAFDIEVNPVDDSRASDKPDIDWAQYDELQLPMVNYEDGISQIVEDINNLLTKAS